MTAKVRLIAIHIHCTH